jgi:hypothetical protein
VAVNTSNKTRMSRRFTFGIEFLSEANSRNEKLNLIIGSGPFTSVYGRPVLRTSGETEPDDRIARRCQGPKRGGGTIA